MPPVPSISIKLRTIRSCQSGIAALLFCGYADKPFSGPLPRCRVMVEGARAAHFLQNLRAAVGFHRDNAARAGGPAPPARKTRGIVAPRARVTGTPYVLTSRDDAGRRGGRRTVTQTKESSLLHIVGWPPVTTPTSRRALTLP